MPTSADEVTAKRFLRTRCAMRGAKAATKSCCRPGGRTRQRFASTKTRASTGTTSKLLRLDPQADGQTRSQRAAPYVQPIADRGGDDQIRSAAAVRPRQDLQQMAARFLEIEAASPVASIDPVRLGAKRI